MFVAGEMLHVAEAFIDKNYHPTVICRGIITSAFGTFHFCLWMISLLLIKKAFMFVCSLQ